MPGADFILAECPACEGAGEWDEGPYIASSGATEPDYRQVFCPECEGTGQALVPAEPIDLEDLETIPNPTMESLMTDLRRTTHDPFTADDPLGDVPDFDFLVKDGAAPGSRTFDVRERFEPQPMTEAPPTVRELLEASAAVHRAAGRTQFHAGLIFGGFGGFAMGIAVLLALAHFGIS